MLSKILLLFGASAQISRKIRVFPALCAGFRVSSIFGLRKCCFIRFFHLLGNVVNMFVSQFSGNFFFVLSRNSFRISHNYSVIVQ